MKRLIITDLSSNEELERKEFSGGYNITLTNTHDGGNLQHIRKLDNGRYDEKYWIKNYYYRPIAEKLIQKFEEISHIRPEKILFLEDYFWKPTGSAKKPWRAHTKKAPGELNAMSGYEYIMIFRQYYIERMSGEQIVATMYHELRHIDKDGGLIPHDVEDWNNMIGTLGVKWQETKSSILDILDNEFPGWDLIREPTRQVTIDDLQDGKVVQFKAR